MTRKILSGIVIALAAIFLILSLVGVGAIWFYNQPLTDDSLAKINEIDFELAQAGAALQSAEDELERALRIVESAEGALEALTEQTAMAKEFLDSVVDVLDETITPTLETAKEKIDEVRIVLEDLQASVDQINRIPFVNLEIPGDEMLTYFIEITNLLEGEITRVEAIAEQASTFMSDSSYLLGGDLLETKTGINNLMAVVGEYGTKINDWRTQLASLESSLPGWIDRGSIILTVFLLWFGFSQVSLLLQGLSAWEGGDPLAFFRRDDK